LINAQTDHKYRDFTPTCTSVLTRDNNNIVWSRPMFNVCMAEYKLRLEYCYQPCCRFSRCTWPQALVWRISSTGLLWTES